MVGVSGLATLGATALWALGLLVMSSFYFNDPIETQSDSFVWGTAALSLSLVLGPYVAYKSVAPQRSWRVAIFWVGSAIALSCCLSLFMKHDNHKENVGQQGWIKDMNELRHIREDTGVKFYVWVRTSGVTHNTYNIYWNSDPVSFTKWSMNTAVAFGANGLLMFLLSGQNKYGPAWYSPVIQEKDTGKSYKAHFYDELSSALSHVDYSGKKIKEFQGKIQSMYTAKKYKENGCALKSVQISKKNPNALIEDLDVLVTEFSTNQNTTLIFIVNNHLARCVLLHLDFGKGKVTELTNDLNTSLPKLGYRSIHGEVPLCAGDSKLFLIDEKYPSECKKDFEDQKNPYLLPLMIVTPLVGALGAIVIVTDLMGSRRQEYEPLLEKVQSKIYSGLQY